MSECSTNGESTECSDQSAAAERLRSAECASLVDGRSDWIGNRAEGESCGWNWQCSAQLGLVCRPLDYHGWSEFTCRPLGQELGAAALDGEYCGELCDSDRDCATGTSCVGVYPPNVAYIGAGMCLGPGHKDGSIIYCEVAYKL